jgi:hypothetical protein
MVESPKAALLAAAALIAAGQAGAGSPITGNWVADLDSQQGLPTDVYLVRDGTYSCESCTPPRRYPADGRLRPVAGNPAVSEAATIVDSRTLATRTVQPDLDRVTRMKVARDGQSATYVSIDRRPGIKDPLRTEYLARRTAPAPAGAHAASGTWQGVRYVSVPVQLRTTILTDDGERLSYRTGTGYSYSAAYGRGFVPIRGPYDGSLSVSVRRDGPNRVVEIRRQGGSDVQRRTYTVSSEGRLEIATTNLATGNTFRVTARRRAKSRHRARGSSSP